MNDNEAIPSSSEPWNKGKLVGAKPPLRASHVWSIPTKLAARETHPRSRTIQSGHRQQIARMRCRRGARR
jgi:hypothetical protein